MYQFYCYRIYESITEILFKSSLTDILNACISVFTELDDGAYNPLWTMRGFTQTFHFWKENRRAQSVPLNAFLTYITLPWWSIAKGKTFCSYELFRSNVKLRSQIL